jgi:hypothetical protein
MHNGHGRPPRPPSGRQPGISTSNNRTGTNSQSGQSTYQSGGGGGEFGGITTPTSKVGTTGVESFKGYRDTTKSTYVPPKREIDEKTGLAYYGDEPYIPPGYEVPSKEEWEKLGLTTDRGLSEYDMWRYGEFGYGPGKKYSDDPDFKSWLSKYKGIVDPNYEPSWSDITQFGIRTGKPWADPNWLVGGSPGQIGHKLDLSGVTTGGGGGGWPGWGGYGGGGGGGGGYYGPQAGYTPEQMAGFYTPQANLQQAMVNVHQTPTGFQPGYKRGGIVSLLELRS